MMPSFWRAVMSDENGIPDEANVLLFVAVFALIGSAILIAFGNPVVQLTPIGTSGTDILIAL